MSQDPLPFPGPPPGRPSVPFNPYRPPQANEPARPPFPAPPNHHLPPIDIPMVPDEEYQAQFATTPPPWFKIGMVLGGLALVASWVFIGYSLLKPESEEVVSSTAPKNTPKPHASQSPGRDLDYWGCSQPRYTLLALSAALRRWEHAAADNPPFRKDGSEENDDRVVIRALRQRIAALETEVASARSRFAEHHEMDERSWLPRFIIQYPRSQWIEADVERTAANLADQQIKDANKELDRMMRSGKPEDFPARRGEYFKQEAAGWIRDVVKVPFDLPVTKEITSAVVAAADGTSLPPTPKPAAISTQP